jgi:hypothetical protein
MQRSCRNRNEKTHEDPLGKLKKKIYHTQIKVKLLKIFLNVPRQRFRSVHLQLSSSIPDISCAVRQM